MKKNRDFKKLAGERMFRKFGVLAGATAIYGAIIVALLIAYTMNLVSQGIFNSMATMQMYMDEVMTAPKYFFIPQLAFMLVGAIMSTVSVSIKYMCLKTARGQEIKLSDILYVIKNNPDKVIIIYVIGEILMFLFSIPTNVLPMIVNVEGNAALQILSFALLVFSYLADIFIMTLFSQAMFLYIDNPMENAIHCIEMSVHVMKKHTGRYISLLISFIPLYLLASLSFGLFYLWVMPFTYTTYALFYMQLKGELGSTIDVTIQ